MAGYQQTTLHFYHIPLDCRVRALEYILPNELYANYALTSRLCHRDSLDSSLPQNKWGELYISGNNNTRGTGEPIEQNEISMELLLNRLSHPSFQNAWGAPRRHMKILGHERNGLVVTARTDDVSFEEMQEQASLISFGDVTSLDISVSDALIKESDDEREKYSPSLNRVLPRSLPWLFAVILPGLVELDLSNLQGGPISEGDYISELSLFNASNCPNLRIIRWNKRVGGCYFLRGKDMRTLENLTELYVDDILCDWRFDKLFAPLMNQFFEESSIIERFFFFACNKSLERVSLLGGKYVTMGPLAAKIDFPQWTLMRFVRKSTKLTWFRSDLTPDNIKVLSKERPEIHFCNRQENL